MRTMTNKNVWTLLLEGHEDVVDLAENTVAAAIGADANPKLLTEQIWKCTKYVFGGPDKETGSRANRLAAAFAGISRGLTSSFGSAYAEVKEEFGEEVDLLEVRNAESQALHAAVQALRETIAGDSGDD
jgi:hypothetical protein